jgi:uncharacterized membrane protein YqiK
LVINAQLSQPEEVWNEKAETATTTMEVVEELPEDWLEEAEAARQAVIDRKRAEAELNDVQAQIEALRVRETELEKELDLY